jgi:hypothetical protein
MKSLKAFLPTLSEHTGLSVTALYERQRALVRLGLLPAPSKSGRNSGGAMATPGSVGVMVLSVLVTDRLSEMDERILEFLSLKAYPFVSGRGKPGHCTLTGERTLYRALQAVLDHRTEATMVEISVDRQRKLVHLRDADPAGPDPCTFGEYPPTLGQIRHEVSFGGLFSLAEELWPINHPEGVPLVAAAKPAVNTEAA